MLTVRPHPALTRVDWPCDLLAALRDSPGPRWVVGTWSGRRGPVARLDPAGLRLLAARGLWPAQHDDAAGLWLVAAAYDLALSRDGVRWRRLRLPEAELDPTACEECGPPLEYEPTDLGPAVPGTRLIAVLADDGPPEPVVVLSIATSMRTASKGPASKGAASMGAASISTVPAAATPVLTSSTAQ